MKQTIDVIFFVSRPLTFEVVVDPYAIDESLWEQISRWGATLPYPIELVNQCNDEEIDMLLLISSNRETFQRHIFVATEDVGVLEYVDTNCIISRLIGVNMKRSLFTTNEGGHHVMQTAVVPRFLTPINRDFFTDSKKD